MKYEKFTKYMFKLKEHMKKVESYADSVEEAFPGGWERVYESAGTDLIIELFEKLAKDKSGWIAHHIYECDGDYGSANSVWFDKYGNERPINNDRDLFALIKGDYETNGERLENRYTLTEKGLEYLRNMEK